MNEEVEDMEIFKEDFIKSIDVKKVCSGFKSVDSFDNLKKNMIFRNLFKNIGSEIGIENEVDMCGEEYITSYTRDIYLMAQWYESMEKNGKSKKYIESQIDRLAYFYTILQRYIGEFLHELSFSGIIEVFEVWIIKSSFSPSHIDQYTKTIERFYRFLEKAGVEDIQYDLLDAEEIDDLKRVAQEFKIGILEQNDEDYIDWRERNIKYYM